MQFELPRDYDGPLIVQSSGLKVAEFRVGDLDLAPTQALRVKMQCGDVCRAPTLAAVVPRAVADVTRTRAPRADVLPATGPTVDTVHVHELRGRSPLPDGTHNPLALPADVGAWLVAQILGAGTAIDLAKNQAVLRELGTRFYIESGRYIIFKGNPRLRTYLTGSRYRVDNPKVLTITAGAPGRLGAGLADAVRGQRIAVIILGGARAVEAWLKGEGFARALAEFVAVAIKSVIAAALTTAFVAGLIGGAVFFGAFAAGAAVPIGVVVVGGMLLNAVLGGYLDLIDNNVGGTKALADAFERTGAWLSDLWRDGIVGGVRDIGDALAREHAAWERDVLARYGVPGGLR